jgi:peptide deformylase
MAKKIKIVQYGNPVLEQVCEEVDIKDLEGNKEIVEKLISAVAVHGDGAAGISAPQIGIPKRIALCRKVDDEGNAINPKDIKWEILLNPVIKDKSKKTSTRWEGCLSVNRGELFGKVTRSREVEVEYFDLEGNKKSLNAKDYFSHIVQHEIDHLDGVLFLKYIPDPTKLYTSDELDQLD